MGCNCIYYITVEDVITTKVGTSSYLKSVALCAITGHHCVRLGQGLLVCSQGMSVNDLYLKQIPHLIHAGQAKPLEKNGKLERYAFRLDS
jgi:hypothetical protein